jgi:hypothetical protein
MVLLANKKHQIGSVGVVHILDGLQEKYSSNNGGNEVRTVDCIKHESDLDTDILLDVCFTSDLFHWSFGRDIY